MCITQSDDTDAQEDLMRLRTAVVTGASRGIGRQIALDLARHDIAVVAVARSRRGNRHGGSAHDTAREIVERGGRAVAVVADVSDPDDADRIIGTGYGEFGSIDILVNNAADTSGGTPGLVDLEMSDWLRQFETNLHAPFRLMQSVVPDMIAAGGGLILNMTSGAGDLERVAEEAVLGGPRLAYSASKAALNRLSAAVAVELRPAGIAVISVDPGFTRTELVDRMAVKGIVDASSAVPMSVPADVVTYLATSGRAMEYSGEIVRAGDFLTLRSS